MPPPSQNFILNGFHRAKVVSSKDPKRQGRVLVWIPDIMPEIDDTKGLWARSANNPVGGRNSIESGETQSFQGTSYIPVPNSWVYVFFEQGNPNEPRYFAACDLGHTTVPIENQQGKNPDQKWTLFKSKHGRTILISDDESDCRVEITGKKRTLANPGKSVAGNESSVYAIDGNQTVILLDERDGQERILIKDYKGNYINLDTQTQKLHMFMHDDIHIETEKNMFIKTGQDYHLNSGKSSFHTTALDVNVNSGTETKIKSGTQTNIKAGTDVNIASVTSTNIDSDGITNVFSVAAINVNSPGPVNIDGTVTNQQMGVSAPATAALAKVAQEAIPATPATPIGDRNDPATTAPLDDIIESETNSLINTLSKKDLVAIGKLALKLAAVAKSGVDTTKTPKTTRRTTNNVV